MRRVVLILCFLLFLTGCTYTLSVDKFPEPDDDVVWICENPRAEFYWGKNEVLNSKMYVDETEYVVGCARLTHSPYVMIYDKRLYNQEYDKYKKAGDLSEFEDFGQFDLLKCKALFSNNHFDLTVEEDLVNMFGGEKPKLHFEKRNKAEYLKEIGEEP